MSPRASLPGVDELFGPRAPKDGEVISVALERLVAASDNPRRDVGDVSDLAASIRSVGLLEPLIVCQQGPSEPYLVVAGHRRLAAAALAGLSVVPVIVRRLTDAERTEIMVIENLQREGLAPLEEALAYRRLIDLGYSQRKLAERVGSSQATVSKRLALLNLPEAARAALDSGRITLEDAQALTKLNNLPERAERALAQPELRGDPGGGGGRARGPPDPESPGGRRAGPGRRRREIRPLARRRLLQPQGSCSSPERPVALLGRPPRDRRRRP